MSKSIQNSTETKSQGSYCLAESDKDRVIVFKDKDLKGPLKDEYFKYLTGDDEPGVILPNGQINWNCPCLGTMASGPCAVPFRKAFSCFHYSDTEIKGINCIAEFDKLQECMKKYPKLYADDKKSTTNFDEKKTD